MQGKVLVEVPVGARPLQKTARPLSGPEVKAAVRGHALKVALEGARQAGFVDGDEEVANGLDRFGKEIDKILGRYSSLDGANLVYPRVWWHLRVIVQYQVERDEKKGALMGTTDQGPHFYAHLKLGLTSARTWELEVGQPVEGLEESLMVEDAQASNNVPDLVRREHGLPVTAQVRLRDGSVAEVLVPQGQGPRINSVDIGPGVVMVEREDVRPPSPPPATAEVKAEELIGEPPAVEMIEAVEQAPTQKPEVKVKAPAAAASKAKPSSGAAKANKPDPSKVTKVDI